MTFDEQTEKVTECHPCHESENDAPQWHLNDDHKPLDELAEDGNRLGIGRIELRPRRGKRRCHL